ncbi:acyl-CoA synthetase (AMP-forming)/AMP-acid ligase II [Zhongshania antarctica]|uniref:Acyl-CoA synthetase (AMP-forming)/AMP-acid ligase II n=1 Tax=Zhongshania antarctica TaxID=641702 RepID=A0A840R026_9GAMM|nr:long-chain-fatty-acid--CoA ligase [Zhongshania antarctica]MBB5185916.1 acyl-CoA synthetase (AMP-forming)/AMP-acid ligase II [Zhongshania antarctica]
MLIHQMIEFNAINHSEQTAIKFGEHSQTYADFNQLANRLARGLIALGLSPGSRVALLSKNNAEFPLIATACMKSGLCLVPLNYRLAAQEVAYILRDCSADVLICGDDTLCLLAEQSGETESIPHRFSLAQTTEIWPSIACVYSDNSSKLASLDQHEKLIAAQIYTSGTTGHPKGVMIGYQQLLSGYVMSNHISPRQQVAHNCIMPLPLFHVAGFAAMMFWLGNGCSIELVADFHPQEIVDAITSSSNCDIVLVPAMIQAMLAFVPNIQDYDFTPLKRITYGASPISIDVLQQALAIFKCDFVQGFGMSELSCMVLSLSADDHRRALAGEPQLLRSCGRALPGAELKIINEQGSELPTGETGELLVRSPTTMIGYWQQADKTAQTLCNGWLRTGDAGFIDDEGYFYIRDRVKDMIVSGGENIYPAEIENALFSHPQIQDVAVIGVPDHKFGETPLAICVLTPGSELLSEDLIAYCKERLAAYKSPRQFEFIAALPRNPSGKVLKRLLREPYWRDAERQVG